MRFSNRVIPAIALVAAGAALTAGTVAATSEPSDAPVAGASATVTAPSAQELAAIAKAQRRERIKAQYGIFPLPVKESVIKKWRLKRRDLRNIVAARKLANSSKGRRVRYCESNHNYRLIDTPYYGAWQFDRQTWLSNGGGRFGRTANVAPPWAQDLIMWKTHKARGWQPWGCA